MSNPSLASFPPAFMASIPPVDMGMVGSVAQRVFHGGEPVPQEDFQKAMFGLLLNNLGKINSLETKVETTAEHAKKNEERIKALEDKAGEKEE